MSAPARPRGHQDPAGHHADGARRGSRARARAFGRRRRLRRKTLLRPGVDGARARAATAQPARTHRRTIDRRRPRPRSGNPTGAPVLARRSSRPRRNFACWNICSRGPAAFFRARSCSTAYGVNRSKSTSAPSTFMSDVYAKRCRAAASETRSAPCAAPAIRSTKRSAKLEAGRDFERGRRPRLFRRGDLADSRYFPPRAVGARVYNL